MEFAATGANKGEKKTLFAVKGFEGHHAKHEHTHQDKDGGDCKSKCSSEESEHSKQAEPEPKSPEKNGEQVEEKKEE